MGTAKKHWTKSEWGVGIGVAIFSFLLTIGYDFVKKVPVLNTIGNILKAIWNFIISFLNFDIKVWWILCFLAIVIVVLYIIAKVSNTKEIFTTPILPKYLEYKSDNVKGYRFSWNWHKRQDGKFGVTDFTIHCPKCDTPMKGNPYADYYTCPRCDHTTRERVSCEDAERVIVDNANRMLARERNGN